MWPVAPNTCIPWKKTEVTNTMKLLHNCLPLQQLVAEQIKVVEVEDTVVPKVAVELLPTSAHTLEHVDLAEPRQAVHDGLALRACVDEWRLIPKATTAAGSTWLQVRHEHARQRAVLREDVQLRCDAIRDSLLLQVNGT